MPDSLRDSLFQTRMHAVSKLSKLEEALNRYYQAASEIQAQVSYYQDFIQDIEKRIKEFDVASERMRHNDPSGYIEDSPTLYPTNALASPPQYGGQTSNALNIDMRNSYTVKDMIFIILKGAPYGLDIQRIADYMESTFGAIVPKTTLSPQLSRLKQHGFVSLQDGERWLLTERGYYEDERGRASTAN